MSLVTSPLMCGPHFCSMKITEDVRKFAAEQKISEERALKVGSNQKAKEFVEKGRKFMSLKNLKYIVTAASTLVGLLALVGCKSPESKPVRIGYLPIYVDLPLFIAKEQGFFEKRGVKVDLKRFASSPEIGTALVTGDVQVGASIAYSVVLSIESRDAGKLKVFIVDSETPENYLSSFVALSGSDIKTVADLKGKKLASFPGPTAVTFCKMVLEKFGLNSGTDLQLIELDVGTQLSALESKTVDALFTYEPTATQAVLEKGAVKILAGAVESQIINPWQAGVWVVSDDFAKRSSTQAHQVMLALYDAVDFIRSNPQAAKRALANYTSIKPTVADATPNIPFAKIGEVNMAAFQHHADILHERGVVSKSIDAAKLLIPADQLK
jgi:NitT/TauT family transport system substrate-binding protein